MREERFLTATRFFALLNDFVWRATKFYDAQYVSKFIVERVSLIQEKILRISSFAHGLISFGFYDRAYLSELNTLINEFVREYEEILDSSLSEEEKFRKLEMHVQAYIIRLGVLEDDIKKDYILKTLEDFLENHRSVLGKDFSLKDLLDVLKRALPYDDDEESPLV
jgi:transcription termination factor NusB